MIVLRSFAAVAMAIAMLISTADLAAYAEASAEGKAAHRVEGIAAQVGNQIVLISEVMALAGPVEERMRQSGASGRASDSSLRQRRRARSPAGGLGQ